MKLLSMCRNYYAEKNYTESNDRKFVLTLVSLSLKIVLIDG